MQDKPFLLYVAFNEPHEPIATDPRHEALYRARHPDDRSLVAYYGNVTQIDAALARVLSTLGSEGLAGSTQVWFMSDSGPARRKE